MTRLRSHNHCVSLFVLNMETGLHVKCLAHICLISWEEEPLSSILFFLSHSDKLVQRYSEAMHQKVPGCPCEAPVPSTLHWLPAPKMRPWGDARSMSREGGQLSATVVSTTQCYLPCALRGKEAGCPHSPLISPRGWSKDIWDGCKDTSLLELNHLLRFPPGCSSSNQQVSEWYFLVILFWQPSLQRRAVKISVSTCSGSGVRFSYRILFWFIEPADHLTKLTERNLYFYQVIHVVRLWDSV